MRILRLLPLLLLSALAPAQNVPATRTLADLQRAFAAQFDAMYSGDQTPTRDQELTLRRRQVEELGSFLQHEAKGNDRWEGRLMLADMNLQLRQRDAAVTALAGMDTDGAPPLMLLAAADMALAIEAGELGDTLIQHALDREASLEERMEMAKVLMTRLRMVERGEAIFAAALGAAADDEQRALVRYYQCEAIREREDIPENSYYVELDKLAKDLPDTYWGGVARDRNQASQFSLGAPAIGFSATALDGSTQDLEALRGKAVLLLFWSALDPSSAELAATVAALQQAKGDDLHVLAVSVDPDPAAAGRAAKAMGAAFPMVCDGRGWRADLALRYHVESVPTLIAIDRQGRIAGLNLHADTKMAREDLTAAVTRALQSN
ncbi:MAG: TlpA family protein disulfide reductase [Planctomycetota bacterium]